LKPFLSSFLWLIHFFISMLESLREIWQYRPLIVELVRRDLKLRYKNSIGGIAWSLLNPLMQVAVITFVMKFFKENPVANYSAYLLGVLFLWNFIQTALSDGCISILLNQALVRKIYFPRAILPLTTLISNGFHFLISFGFTLFYLTFITRSYPSLLTWNFLLVIPILFFTFILCLGCNLVLSYLNVFYEDIRFMVTAFAGVFFYLLPILYTVEDVRNKLSATPWLFNLYMLNPVTTLLTMYQRALLPPPEVKTALKQTLPPLNVPQLLPYFALSCVMSVLALIVGFALFERYKWEMVERL
jgi:lipopolysaccharide transport system permease protein